MENSWKKDGGLIDRITALYGKLDCA